MWQPAHCVTFEFSLCCCCFTKVSCQPLRFDPAPVFDVLVIISCVFSDSFLHTVETRGCESQRNVCRRPSRVWARQVIAAELNTAEGRNQSMRSSNCGQDKIYHFSRVAGNWKQRLHEKRARQMFTDVKGHVLFAVLHFSRPEKWFTAGGSAGRMEWVKRSAVRNTSSCGTLWLTDLFLDNNGTPEVAE